MHEGTAGFLPRIGAFRSASLLALGIQQTLGGAEIARLLRRAIAGQFLEFFDKDVGVGLWVAEEGHESDQCSAGFLGN